jgi:ABC-2 type transport system ATP-binding protein
VEGTLTELKNETFWSKSADTYMNDTRYVAGEAVLQEVLIRLSAERDLGEVVEFGCGTGHLTKIIALHAEQVVATDLSDEILAVAREQLAGLPNVTVHKADAEGTTFPPERFDTALMVNVIHVVENPRAALRESHRILKNGRRLLVVSLTGYGMPPWARMALGLRYLRKFGIPKHSRNYSPDGLVALVESAGFEVARVQLVGDQTKALYLTGAKL